MGSLLCLLLLDHIVPFSISQTPWRKDRQQLNEKNFQPSPMHPNVNETPNLILPKSIHYPATGLEEHMALAFKVVEPCPVTFLYDLPEYWDFGIPLSGMDNLKKIHQGTLCTNGVRDINQYSLLARVIYRLKTSKRCVLTSDPNKADLFLVPMFPKPKLGKDICKGFVIEDLEEHLPYLTTDTAHKHVILLSKGHTSLDKCGSWWKRPAGMLQKVIRVAYSLPWRGNNARSGYGPTDVNINDLFKVAKGTGDFLNDSTAYPHLYSVPYPSSMELQGAKKRLQGITSYRPFLLHFGGGFHGKFGLDLRKKIVADCKRAKKYQCLIQIVKRHSDICKALKGKRISKFCFEPGGDSPYRKSMYDSIALGCIPVLLSPYQLLVPQWHLGHFRDSATVYLDREIFMKDEVNIFKYLETLVSNGSYIRMRKSLQAHSHAAQYALQDYPGDAFERLMVGIKRASTKYEERNK